MLLSPTGDIRAKTELNIDEIIAISDLNSMVQELKEKYNVNLERIEKFVKEFLILKISYNRKSRSESVELTKQLINDREKLKGDDIFKRDRII